MPPIPQVYINLGYFTEVGGLPAPLMLWRIFTDGGWILVLVALMQGLWLLWIQWRRGLYAKTVGYCIMAIDVPRMNEQTPKAVEHIFEMVASAYAGFDRYEKYWLGKIQPTFSFELVSISGYVQFLAYCPVKFRDMIEAAIYSQYPEAEIVEVADYTDRIPAVYPHPEWEAFGTEFVLKKPSHLPIRTYIQFEHSLSEEYFKDPIAPTLEVMGALKEGEQLWLQILCEPTDDDWKDASRAAVDKIMGKKPPVKTGLIEELGSWPMMVVTEATGIGPGESAPAKKEEQPKMMSLTPGEKNILEAVQMKASKLGMRCKVRMVYAGKRSVFNKGRISGIRGAMSQFTSLDMNGLKTYGAVTPKTDYPWQRWAAPTKLMAVIRNYRNRSGKGATAYILNTEELATLYHFPYVHVKAPLVKKTEAKRGEPPTALPTLESYAVSPFKPKSAVKPAEPKKAPPPAEVLDEDEEGLEEFN
jgi:hypothetical protein